jgi:hypothetical protein
MLIKGSCLGGFGINDDGGHAQRLTGSADALAGIGKQDGAQPLTLNCLLTAKRPSNATGSG